MDKIKELENKLQELRDRWVKEPKNRRIIKGQAWCIKMALEKANKKIKKTGQLVIDNPITI